MLNNNQQGNCREWLIADNVELQRRDGLYFVNGEPIDIWYYGANSVSDAIKQEAWTVGMDDAAGINDYPLAELTDEQTPTDALMGVFGYRRAEKA